MTRVLVLYWPRVEAPRIPRIKGTVEEEEVCLEWKQCLGRSSLRLLLSTMLWKLSVMVCDTESQHQPIMAVL